MPTPKPSQTHVCLSCLLRSGAITKPSFTIQPRGIHVIDNTLSRSFATSTSRKAPKRPRKYVSPSIVVTEPTRRSMASSTTEPISLDKTQIVMIGQYHSIQQRLEKGLSQVPEAKENKEAIPIETLVAVLKSESGDQPADRPFLRNIEKIYVGKSYGDVQKDLKAINKHRRPSMMKVEDDTAISVLKKLGLLKDEADLKGARSPQAATGTRKEKKKITGSESTQTTVHEADGNAEVPLAQGRSLKRRERVKRAKLAAKSVVPVHKTPLKAIRKVPFLAMKTVESFSITTRKALPILPGKTFDVSTPDEPIARSVLSRPILSGTGPTIIPAPRDVKTLDGSFIAQRALEEEATLPVPRLSFDLSRVLFNPGVYHLQDPRSRVYNFDPYLENIMPVSEFNFDALNPYITSSQDNHLRNVSLKHGKRYIGSSSSMSGVMSHFHFLFSAWRPLDMSMLSKKIGGQSNFTLITRAPAGIFLRWRDGVYAVDADKEHDTPNILMMQGKSMEKLLTLEKDDFEKYRRQKVGDRAPAIDSDPESYHYSGCENFLLRSQLDAWDPRLPGTGMFDLKTRACAGIRMDMSNHEVGMGYQIKERFGEWESFDREYFDMMRAAFLKYSLQVRMGRMDGIFVAYHNIERIFGFQYISLPEMDAGLHGQSDPTVGDREFKMTVKLMNEVFDLATKEFPQRSMRFIFETRDPTKTDPNGIMRVFAEPMSEKKIDKIQSEGKKRVEEYEKNMATGLQQALSRPLDGQSMGGQTLEAKLSPSTLESNSADVAFLEEIMRQQDPSEGGEISKVEEVIEPVACWMIKIHNEVNGKSVIRPNNITSSDRWLVKYRIERIADTQARGLYNSCKARRATTLGHDIEAKKDNYFIEKIRGMNEAGRVWREIQNEKDSQREKVVLYNSERVASASP